MAFPSVERYRSGEGERLIPPLVHVPAVKTPYEPVESPDATTIFPYHDLTPPTATDVYRARSSITGLLPRTPLVRSTWLSAELDADIYLKREDSLPTGAFKVRGGINLVANLADEFRDRGLVAASTGNHGLSISYAGSQFDVPVMICVPEEANPGKVAAIERLGATVERHGADYDESRKFAEKLATDQGYRYVHSANEPALIAGVGTAGLEVVEDLPDVEVCFSPIGGGSSASGYCLTVGALADATVIGVQSAAAPAAYRAWEHGDLSPHDTMKTFAEGLATRVPFALTMDILREHLDDFVLVDDDALREGIRRMLEEERILMEGAASTGVAAAFELRESLAGKTVVFPVSGRNISMDNLRAVLERT